MRPGVKPKAKLAGGFERANAVAARVIIEDPARFGGEEAALVRWARLVVMKGRTGEGLLSFED